MTGNRARHVIAQQWVSVDGFAAGPTDETDIFAAVDDMSGSEEYNRRLLEHVDEVLLGRRSYESFVGSGRWQRASRWPRR